jgi:predicted 3-demethylubiquinone-9 3-methyltransferase (glyoxalase superfamily)
MDLTEKLKSIPASSPLDMAEPDECCFRALSKALASGSLKQKTSWVHDKCGCEWQARTMADGSRFWYPVVQVWII